MVQALVVILPRPGDQRHLLSENAADRENDETFWSGRPSRSACLVFPILEVLAVPAS